MKITQKRICGDCWGLMLNPCRCTFGFKICSGIKMNNRFGDIKPLEPCPKPLNNKDYVACLKLKEDKKD